jgi:hypothetical protein
MPVEVFIEHPPENSMASFDSTSVVLDGGTTFVFDSWVCVTNGSGGFNIHLADTRNPETSAATRRNDLGKLNDNLDKMLLPNFAGEIKKMSVFDATSTRAASGLLGLDSP